MNTSKLMDFFKLENQEVLFEEATKPKSCGGGEEYEILALLGDVLLNKSMIAIFSNIRDAGIQSKLRSSFHSRRALIPLGKHLEVDKVIINYNDAQEATDNEIKETIEALIAASFQVNDLMAVKNIVEELISIALKEDFLDYNYLGDLNELFQQERMELPVDKYIQVGGSDHNPIWQCILKGRIFDKEFTIQSESYKRKSDAKQDAACKFLFKLGYTNQQTFYTPYEEEKIVTKKTKQLTLDSEIIFSEQNSLFKTTEFDVKLKESESLIDWATRKIEKNPFFFFIQIVELFDEIKGFELAAELDDGVLIILNINIDKRKYYEIGLGTSKTKARFDAGNKMVSSTNIVKWLDDKKI